MTSSPTTEHSMPMDAPPRWAKTSMKWALTTPVIQSMVGQGVALLTSRRAKDRQALRHPGQLSARWRDSDNHHQPIS